MLFNFMNNFYGMGGQPKGETMGFDVLARAGLGVNPEGMHAERVDGYNPLAVADAIERKKALLEAGRGPVLLDTVTYRFSGHSPSDASAYRTKEEVDLWMQQDALVGYGAYLLQHEYLDESSMSELQEAVIERLVRVLDAAVSLEVSPRISMGSDEIGEMMFSNQRRDRMADGTPATLQSKEESRLSATLAKFRFGLDEEGKPRPKLRCVSYAEALFEAMIHRFYSAMP
jgi:2-oxoisovalerate dehydrogenase E1 component